MGGHPQQRQRAGTVVTEHTAVCGAPFYSGAPITKRNTHMTFPSPPVARRDSGPDPYAWLRHDTDAAVAYLEEENQYCEHALEALQPLEQTLLAEFAARHHEDGRQTPAVANGPWLYYQRLEGNDEHPRHYRSPWHDPAHLEPDLDQAQLLLDPNRLATGGYLDVRDSVPSPDHRYLAYSVDTQGDEQYQVVIKELASGIEQRVPGPPGVGLLAWADDNRSVFYISVDPEQWRPDALYRFTLGNPQAQRVHHEADPGFLLGSLRRSASGDFLLLEVQSPASNETWVLDPAAPEAPPVCLAARQPGLQYSADHGVLGTQPCWFLRTNDGAPHFKLMTQATLDRQLPQPGCWVQCVAQQDDTVITDLALKADGFVLSVRHHGLPALQLYPAGLPPYTVQGGVASYSLHWVEGPAFASPYVHMRVESFTQPAQVWRLALATGERTLVRGASPIEGFDPAAYRIERHWAPAADGTQVPISLARRATGQGPAPLLMLAYGAYSITEDPTFKASHLSLLERGFSLAIAHVRGGGARGPAWHHGGRLAHKHNTFSDFIVCAEYLIAQRLTEPAKLVIEGQSAGGLLVGAVLNQRPELFAAAVAQVPFVDVLNSMLDPSLPLTVPDYAEWGNPEEPEVHARIAAYAPYKNVQAQAYPPMLVTAGYHDTRVPYWEPAKWVARLRANKTDPHVLVLQTDMGGGHAQHGGYSAEQRQLARRLAFMLAAVGASERLG